MPVRLHKAGTDKNVWGLTMNDSLNPALLLSNLIIVLNGNNPPTVKAGSKFYVWDEETYLIPDSDPTGNNTYPPDTSVDYLLAQAVFEQVDRTFAWNAGLFPAIGNSKTYYLYCSGGEDTDETSIGKGIYGATETAPTYSELKCGWYLNTGERVIARFQTTGAGVVYGLMIYKSQKIESVFNIDSDYTIADNDGCSVINMTTAGSDKTITLPTLADNIGREITFNKIDSGAAALIIDGEGAETINGETTIAIRLQYGSIKLLATPSYWIVERIIESGSTSEFFTGGYYHDGRPIFAKWINFGSLPNTTTKSVAHGLTFSRILKREGYAYNGTTTLDIPYGSAYSGVFMVSIFTNSSNITIETINNMSGYSECYIRLEFVK